MLPFLIEKNNQTKKKDSFVQEQLQIEEIIEAPKQPVKEEKDERGVIIIELF